jgi:antitoxin (DNA-binding transcriptional repressor) of toxin-antitoxin stability system
MSEPDLVVPAAEANRAFSKLLRMVREGRRVIITSHGEPVAELTQPGQATREEADRERRRQAHQALVDHLGSVEVQVVGPWTREELYERD